MSTPEEFHAHLILPLRNFKLILLYPWAIPSSFYSTPKEFHAHFTLPLKNIISSKNANIAVMCEILMSKCETSPECVSLTRDARDFKCLHNRVLKLFTILKDIFTNFNKWH